MSLLRPRGLHFSTLPQLVFRPLPFDMRRTVHIFLCIADHYEPMHGGAAVAQQRARVNRWVQAYPDSVEGLEDSRGRSPQHTFFYPAEEYNGEHLDCLAELCGSGYGEVEVHLHHDNDSSENLRETLESFTERLFHRHGLLKKDQQGRITYGFVHGNWALDNSRPDGCWCGVNDELTVLRETGCYADFTLPAAPSLAQTRTINSIYYGQDDPCRPKSHDSGVRAGVGVRPPEGGLLIVHGPLLLDWRRRKRKLLPGLENGELHGTFPPTLRRLQLWLRAGVQVAGQPQWVFVKLHTHGAKEGNAAMLLGEPMRRFHAGLSAFAAENSWFRYYYVTAREMASLVHQAEAGASEPVLCATSRPSPERADQVDALAEEQAR